MIDINSLSHTKWECKYHITWMPKYRKKAIYGDLRTHMGEVFRELAHRADCEILEGHLLPGHSHMLISIPPQIFSFQCGWLYQRQKCDSDSEDVLWPQEEFHWPAFLG